MNEDRLINDLNLKMVKCDVIFERALSIHHFKIVQRLFITPSLRTSGRINGAFFLQGFDSGLFLRCSKPVAID